MLYEVITAFLYNPVHLGADFGDPVGGGPTGKIRCQHDRLGPDGHRRDFRNRRRRGRPTVRVLAAPEQKAARQSQEVSAKWGEVQRKSYNFV